MSRAASGPSCWIYVFRRGYKLPHSPSEANLYHATNTKRFLAIIRPSALYGRAQRIFVRGGRHYLSDAFTFEVEMLKSCVLSQKFD